MTSTSQFYSKTPSRFMTLFEVSTYAEAHQMRNIVILPPESGNKDQESDTEDVPDNINAEDALFEPAGVLEVYDGESDNDQTEQEEPTPSKKAKYETPHWRRDTDFTKDIPSTPVVNVADKFPELITKTPYDLWLSFITNELLDDIVENTNLYAGREKNDEDFELSKGELLRFLGILLLSGYHSLPSERHFWSNQLDLGIPIVSEALSSKRFLKIKSMFHLIDNKTLTPDHCRMAKVIPLYDTLNKSFVKYGIFHAKLSIDELMVPYFGRRSCKVFTRGKSVTFGYKIWCLCSSDGYPYHLSMYTGTFPSSSCPLGSRVVNAMVDIVARNSILTNHSFFFGNLFTSYDLLKALAEKDVKAVGAVKETKTANANEWMESDSVMKKSDRGSFDFQTDGNVYFCKWKDNSIVNIGSNYLTHLLVQTVKRRVKNDTSVNISQPFLIKAYNNGKGGVEAMDRLLSLYRPTLRGKKWYWPLILNALNVSVVAAWKLHCAVMHNSMSHLDFRREIAISLMKSPFFPRRQVRGGHIADLPNNVRFDGVDHFRLPVSQGRCKVCQKNTRYMCSKCHVRLHCDKGTLCFDIYHANV